MFHLQHWCTELADTEILDVGTRLTMYVIKEYNSLDILEIIMEELTSKE